MAANKELPTQRSGDTKPCPPLFSLPQRSPQVTINPMDIAPALNAYGHPPIPPPFSKPVRWMVWSKPDPKVERSSNHGSSDSFGEDLDKVDGIEKLSKHGLKILQQKCQQLENDIIRETEKCCFEKAKNEKLVGLLNNSKNQTMTAVGDMVRRNDVLDQKLQAVKKRMAEIENESTLATEQAHSDAARRIRDLRKVIQEREESIIDLNNKLGILQNFAENKEELHNSLEHLRKTLRERSLQQEKEIASVYRNQETEQRKLQGLAADRLLALTEQSYDKALENLDDDTIRVFQKHCQVEDAITVWLNKDKDLTQKKTMLEAKLRHVYVKRQIGVRYLRRSGKKLDALYRHLSACEQYAGRIENDFREGVEKFERQGHTLVPVVLNQMEERKKRTRELQKKIDFRTAECRNIKRQNDTSEEQKSIMEKAVVWAIKSVMEQFSGKGVDEFVWKDREMVLRRVFVMMNLENQNPNSSFEDLVQATQKYVATLENNLSPLAKLVIEKENKVAAQTLEMQLPRWKTSFAKDIEHAQSESEAVLPSFGFQEFHAHKKAERVLDQDGNG